MNKKDNGRLFLAKVIWDSSKERYFWMCAVCIVSLIPQFVSIYGLKIVVDFISRGAEI